MITPQSSVYVYAAFDVFAANVFGAQFGVSIVVFPGSICFVPNIKLFFLAHTTFSYDIALYLCCVCHCFVNVHDFEPLQFEFTPILKKLHMTFHFFLDHQQFFSRSRQIGNNIGQMHTFLGWFFYRGSRVAGGCTQLAVQ
uniref:(northern house mosquito) hypothetical protein n=1 Tax=Culex pipiens TaxID=7175 RepID=A0A8D8BM64_CULPI